MSTRIFILTTLSLLSFCMAAQSQATTDIDSILQEYKSEENDSLRLVSLYNIIVYLNGEQNYDSAYKLSKAGILEAKKSGIPYFKGLYYDELGLISYIKSDYDSALHFHHLALKEHNNRKDSIRIARTLNNIGEDYFAREFYSMAYDYYYRSNKISESVDDSLGLAVSTYNLGRVLKEQGHFDRAISLINEALEISEKIGDIEGIAYANYDLGDILYKVNSSSEAFDKLESALEISKLQGEYLLIPPIYNKLGELYESQDKYDKAIYNYNEALQYNRRMNNKLGIAQNYLGLGSVYTEIGEFARAEQLFNESLDIANILESFELKSGVYLELSELYEKRGEIDKAFNYFKEHKVAQDSLLNYKRGEQLAQLQMEHLLQQNELEIELLNQREAQQQEIMKRQELIRDVLVVIMAFFVILLISLYRSSIRKKKLNKVLLNQQQELEQQSVELKELNKVKDKFFSIISHDLRSPINNLAGMSALLTTGNLTIEETQNLSSSIQKQLRHASKLLDNLMDWVLLQSNEIKIRKENINVRELVEENIEFFNDLNEKNIQIVNKVDDIPVIADKNMLDLIIRNLISNAMKFTEEGGRITISNEEKNGKVMISVADNGIGVPEEVKDTLFDFKAHYSRKGTANEKGTGLGLKLCKEFVERNGGDIWVESEEGEGSTFNFTLERAS